MPTRPRGQIASFLVLRRNPLELWGPAAYRDDVLSGRLFGRERMLVNTPDAIRHVLVDNTANYRRSLAAKRVLQPILGGGLLLAEGRDWRHQRRTITPALSPRTLPVLARHMVHAAAAEEANLRATAGRPVELLRRLQHLALNIAAQSMFSLEMDSFGDALRGLLIRYAKDLARPGFLDLVLPEGLPLPLDGSRRAFRRDWLRLMDRMIDAREAQPRAADGPSDSPRDLFDLLAQARDPETGAGFDRAQLRDEVATMILAGHETTAVTLFWACYMAAIMPDHAARIAAEAAQADLSAENAAAAVKALPFTRAFIDETLRLYPPAFLLVREAAGPDQVAGRHVAPGTVISISPWVLHRHERLWQDPLAFDPGRFLPGAPRPDRYAYLPFGTGPRVCVGAQFALTEAVIVMARLMRRFRLRLLGRGFVVPRGLVTTQPDRPVRFVLEQR